MSYPSTDQILEDLAKSSNGNTKQALPSDDKFKEVFLDSAYDEASFIGKFIHLWQFRFYLKHYHNKRLTLKDIYKLPAKDESRRQYSLLERKWLKALDEAKKSGKKPSIAWPIMQAFIAVFGFLAQFGVLYQAICMQTLISKTSKLAELNANRSINGTDSEFDFQAQSIKHGIYFRFFLMVLGQLVYTNFINVYNYHTMLIGYRIKISLSSLIYRKTLRLSKTAFTNTSSGQIQNLLAGDMSRIEMVFYLISYPVIAFFMSIISFVVMWPYLGMYLMVAFAIIFTIMTIQTWLGKLFSYQRKKAAFLTDDRITLLNEFIPAMRVIKMYGAEDAFAGKISWARKQEVAKIRHCLYLFAILMSMFYFGGKIVVYSTLTCYTTFKNSILDSETLYLTFSVLNKLSFVTLLYTPQFVLSMITAFIAIRRFDKFLSLEEVKERLGGKKLFNKNALVKLSKLSVTHGTIDYEPKTGRSQKDVIELEGVSCFRFTCNEISGSKYETPVLRNISLEAKPGELTFVVGSVGAGKTTLLQTILSELRITSGTIEVTGVISYASQDPWLFTGSVKENILFGSEFNQKRYQEVIRVCALKRDIALWERGDETMISEQGASLSGGQRARINLARALYYEADIYLLDDPLSAVDAHVAKELFKNAIKGFLKDKVVILVTHQLNFLDQSLSAKILLIKNGQQICYGNYDEMKENSDFLTFIAQTATENPEQPEKLEKRRMSGANKFGSQISFQAKLGRQDSVHFEEMNTFYNQFLNSKEDPLKGETEDERLLSNGSKTYIRHMGAQIFFVTIFFVLAQTFYTLSDVFLKYWAAANTSPLDVANPNTTRLSNLTEAVQYKILTFAESSVSLNRTETFERSMDDLDFAGRLIRQLTTLEGIYVYSGIIALLVVSSLVRSIIFFDSCMKASISIHDTIFARLVRAPVSFFDKGTNAFQILNRFSKDMSILDDVLPYRFYDFVEIALLDVAIMVLLVWTEWRLIFLVLILVTSVLIVRNFYLRTARQIGFIEGQSKEPIVHHLTSSINGLSTIRCFKAQERFINRFDIFQNDYSSALFSLITSRRWLVYMMDWIQVIFLTGIFIFLSMAVEKIDPTTMGLVVSNLLSFTAEFQWLVINWTDYSTFLTSVERLDQFKDVEQEPALESSPDKKPSDTWPQKGKIEFKDVSLRYPGNDEPVLKDLNFTIEAREKIGVVGRTGAGKSSLIACLFRMVEYDGHIKIDGVDCKEIGLHDLRKKISIIPQEPVLFTGTVRSNLDPTNSKHSDAQLWDALRETQLEKVVKKLKGGLDAKVLDGGSNFSIGQKQLICFARAILKRNKILILDEATANCDPETDELIQKTLRTVFSKNTIITVAHRLNTIIDADKVLVMDLGQAREFDTPYNLLRISSTLFSSLVDATGQTAKLRALAATKRNGPLSAITAEAE